MESRKHHHGFVYRAKIVPYKGATEYGEWFATESALCSAMKAVTRSIGNRYYCETKLITCPECDVNDPPKVIAAL